MDKQKKFNSLDDIDKKLYQEKKEGASKNSIKNKRRTAKYVESPVMDFLRDYSRLLVIPAAAVLLILIIVIAESIGSGKENGGDGIATLSEAALSEAREGGDAENAASDTLNEGENGAELSSAAETEPFKATDEAEYTRLINDYFYARLNADVDSLYEIFNRTADADRDELLKRLEAERSWIQSYDGISVYLLPGIDENGRVAVIAYRINFRRTDTMAPGIMYCYISKNADGGLYIEENPVKEKLDRMNEALEANEVQELIESTNAELSAALSGDSDLALIYTSFNNGEIYKEQDLDVNREQEVDIMFTPEGSDLTGGQGAGNIYSDEGLTVEIENPASEEETTETYASETEAGDGEAAAETEAGEPQAVVPESGVTEPEP